jgi:hypothetical protein
MAIPLTSIEYSKIITAIILEISGFLQKFITNVIYNSNLDEELRRQFSPLKGTAFMIRSLARNIFRIAAVLALLMPGRFVFSQSHKQLQAYVSADKLYALQKPADWKVVENKEANRLRVQVVAPNEASSVDFLWERNNQRRINAVQHLLAYRQMLRKTWPDLAFTNVYASTDKRQCSAGAWPSQCED